MHHHYNMRCAFNTFLSDAKIFHLYIIIINIIIRYYSIICVYALDPYTYVVSISYIFF